MLRQIRVVFAEAGLKLNAGKCKVQTNARVRTTDLKVDDMVMPIMPVSEGFKILGTQFTLLGRTSVELKARIAAAWGSFHKIWPILSRRDSCLRKRLRIFHSDVRQSLLWCCESWTLTAEERLLLRSTERAMLRRWAGPRRRPEEEFVPWIVRATHTAEKALSEAGMKPCVHVFLQRKWTWAGHVMSMPEARWARRVTKWRDNAWWTQQPKCSLTPSRAGRTHWFRWEDELVRFAHQRNWTSWQDAACAMNTSTWNEHAEDFVAFTCRTMRSSEGL